MSLHFRVINVAPSMDLRQKGTDALAAAHEAGRLGTFGGPWLHQSAPDMLIARLQESLRNQGAILERAVAVG